MLVGTEFQCHPILLIFNEKNDAGRPAKLPHANHYILFLSRVSCIKVYTNNDTKIENDM